MKKIVLFSAFLFVCLLAIQVPVYADVTCAAFDNEILIDNKIINVVHTIILIIQIVVPILLVIFGMIDLVKGVMAQKEDEIKKGQQTFIKRLIAAAVVFFVIVIVKMLMSLVSADNKGIMACANCFINGTADENCIETSGGNDNTDLETEI